MAVIFPLMMLAIVVLLERRQFLSLMRSISCAKTLKRLDPLLPQIVIQKFVVCQKNSIRLVDIVCTYSNL